MVLNTEKSNVMSYVYDVTAKKVQGRIIHFNVIIDEEDADKALLCAQSWLLDSLGLAGAVVNAENCFFCHSLIVPLAIRKDIDRNGYGNF